MSREFKRFLERECPNGVMPVAMDQEGRKVLVRPSMISRRWFLKGSAVVGAGMFLDALALEGAVARGLLRIVVGGGGSKNREEAVVGMRRQQAAVTVREKQLTGEVNIKPLDKGIDIIVGSGERTRLLGEIKARVGVKLVRYQEQDDRILAVSVTNKDIDALRNSTVKGVAVRVPTITYWNGNKTNINVPEDVAMRCARAAEVTGVDEDLLIALQHSENNAFDCSPTSSAGAKGCFQFIDPTWKVYGGGDVWDPEENTLAAGRMLKAIGLADKFERIKMGRTAEEQKVAIEAFVNNFVGGVDEHGRRQACWNMHEGQARYVVKAALALKQARGEVTGG